MNNNTTNSLEPAICRGCGMKLRGVAYRYGQPAYHPHTGKEVKHCFYGGFVCSKRCDEWAELDQEQSMPGHFDQQTLSVSGQRRINLKWNS